MNPITHVLASWTLADAAGLDERDRSLATWCGVLPDADGLGAVVDRVNELLSRPGTWYYDEYHHGLAHGLLAAIVIPAALCIFAKRRVRMFVVGVLAVHLHYLCDLVGSRGPTADDVWPLKYLAPFSDRWTVQWSGQWALNAWPNVAFTVLLLAYAFARAVRSGRSPVGLFSARADRVFVETVRNRWRSLVAEPRKDEDR